MSKEREPGARRRLSRSGDFDRVYRQGTSRASRVLVVYTFPRAAEETEGEADNAARLGVSVGRKVGGAVERNKVKRALRDAFWALESELAAGQDVVLVARPELTALVEKEGTTGVARELGALLDDTGPSSSAGTPSPEERST